MSWAFKQNLDSRDEGVDVSDRGFGISQGRGQDYSRYIWEIVRKGAGYFGVQAKPL